MNPPITALLVLFLTAGPASAQPALDRAFTPWKDPHPAVVASNLTLAATVAIDSVASWRSDQRGRAFAQQGLRVGVALGLSALMKTLVHRDRPCAPACGAERPDASFWSGHTALAFASTGAHLSVTIPLASGTGVFRIAGGKHWTTDVLAGAGAGLASRWTGSRLRTRK